MMPVRYRTDPFLLVSTSWTASCLNTFVSLGCGLAIILRALLRVKKHEEIREFALYGQDILL
jgi:hypothetical protein